MKLKSVNLECMDCLVSFIQYLLSSSKDTLKSPGFDNMLLGFDTDLEYNSLLHNIGSSFPELEYFDVDPYRH